MIKKVHAKSEVVDGATLCLRAIFVNRNNNLIVTDENSKVSCKQCLSRLMKGGASLKSSIIIK